MGWEHLAEEGKLGRRDPKEDAKHLKLSKTPEEFLKFIGDRSFQNMLKDKILFDISGKKITATGIRADDNWRYVKDPALPGRVIDMNHFIAAAVNKTPFADDIGVGVELFQKIRGLDSNLLEEDFRSNSLGERFGLNYLDKTEKGMNFKEQLKSFFNDRKQGFPVTSQPSNKSQTLADTDGQQQSTATRPGAVAERIREQFATRHRELGIHTKSNDVDAAAGPRDRPEIGRVPSARSQLAGAGSDLSAADGKVNSSLEQIQGNSPEDRARGLSETADQLIAELENLVREPERRAADLSKQASVSGEQLEYDA